MKKGICLSVVLCATALWSCSNVGSSSGDEESAVKDFAIDVATKVSKNQKDSVVMLYPDAAKADSLALSFIADSIKIVPTDSTGIYIVDLGDGKEMSIEKKGEDSLEVTKSKGLFVFLADDLDFAKKTGMWVDSISDAENADRMAQKEAFRKYLVANFKAPRALVVTQGRGSYNGGMTAMDFHGVARYIVTNKSDKPIAGKDYRFVYRREDRGFASRPSTAGRDLAPGASTTYSIDCGMWTIVSGASVVYTATKEQQFDKYFEPQGGEFDKYLESIGGKPVVEKTTESKAPTTVATNDGKIKFAGKLNGKYGVRFELDKNYNGFMYYTSQGYSKTIKISGSLTGNKLTLDETTKGTYTGTYSGTFDGKVYKGTFTRSRDGKNFSFYLSVV